MNTRDWLLNKVMEQDRTKQALMAENKRLLDELVDERQDRTAYLSDLQVDMEQKAKITQLEQIVARMVPEKQFKIRLWRKGMQDATLHIESVASSAGVTTITVRDFNA